MPNQETRIKDFEECNPNEILDKKDLLISTFETASDKFIVKGQNGEIKILASSMDWFTQEWARDAFISLEGLLLIREKYDEAKSFLMKWAKYEKKGLFPRTLEKPQHLADADSPLWFIYAVKKYYEYTRDLSLIIKIKHVINEILYNYIHGTSYYDDNKEKRIEMDDDYLIKVNERATWMDASALGSLPPITPRNGKPIEINALFYDALAFSLYLQEKTSIMFDIDLDFYIRRVRSSIIRKFWDPSLGYVKDVIDGDPKGDALRPNMLFALRLEGLFDEYILEESMNAVNKYLLTPAGIRTLSPHDEDYQGNYNTHDPIEVKDLAYHNGSAWPWIIGAYVDSLYRLLLYEGKSFEEIKIKVAKILCPLLDFILRSPYKTLPELFSGDPPHTPEGTRSQAWSVAEVHRIFRRYLL